MALVSQLAVIIRKKIKFTCHQLYLHHVPQDFRNHSAKQWTVRDLFALKLIVLVSMEAMFRVQQQTARFATVLQLIRVLALLLQQPMLNYLNLNAPPTVKNLALQPLVVVLIAPRANALRFVTTLPNVFHHPAL